MEVIFNNIEKKVFIVDGNLSSQVKFSLIDSIGSLENLFEKTLKLYKRQKTFSNALFFTKFNDLDSKSNYSVNFDVKYFEIEDYYFENDLQNYTSRMVVHLDTIKFEIKEPELMTLNDMSNNDLNILANSLFIQIQSTIKKLSMGDVNLKLNESKFYISSKNIIKSKNRK